VRRCRSAVPEHTSGDPTRQHSRGDAFRGLGILSCAKSLVPWFSGNSTEMSVCGPSAAGRMLHAFFYCDPVRIKSQNSRVFDMLRAFLNKGVLQLGAPLPTDVNAADVQPRQSRGEGVEMCLNPKGKVHADRNFTPYVF